MPNQNCNGESGRAMVCLQNSLICNTTSTASHQSLLHLFSWLLAFHLWILRDSTESPRGLRHNLRNSEDISKGLWTSDLQLLLWSPGHALLYKRQADWTMKKFLMLSSCHNPQLNHQKDPVYCAMSIEAFLSLSLNKWLTAASNRFWKG